MSLTKTQVREILGKADIPADKLKETVDAIISGHTDSIEALREERDSLREEVSQYKDFKQKYEDTQKELDDAKSRLNGEKDYDTLKKEYEDFKNEVAGEKAKASKETALKSLLTSIGIADKRTAAILKVTDLSKIELDKEGKIKNEDKLSDSLKEEWSEFITTQSEKGANTANPQKNEGKKMSKDEILAIKDTGERQKAMLENSELFGI